jgi:hypothetical protein
VRTEARLLIRKDRELTGRQEPSKTDSMQEKKGVPRPGVEGPRGRPEVASRGGRAAIGDRPIWRLGKAAECHATMETASTAYAATPTKDDTLALVPRDRRGASAGVAADLRRPAPCARRRHDRGAVPCAGYSPVAGSQNQASGVSAPAGEADAQHLYRGGTQYVSARSPRCRRAKWESATPAGRVLPAGGFSGAKSGRSAG